MPDSAPVRVRIRARPNSFSVPYRMPAGHARGLKDTLLGKTFWVGRSRGTTNWCGRFYRALSHGRYVALQMAKVAIPRNLFADILQPIAELQPLPAAATA